MLNVGLKPVQCLVRLYKIQRYKVLRGQIRHTSTGEGKDIKKYKVGYSYIYMHGFLHIDIQTCIQSQLPFHSYSCFVLV